MKRLLFTLLNLVFLCILYGQTNAIIVGSLEGRGAPCNSEECPTWLVTQITNDTASFVLVQDGNYVDFGNLTGISLGSQFIAIYGEISEKKDNNGHHYELVIKEILNNKSENMYSASCDEEILSGSQEPTISIQNDSIIIEHLKVNQCAAKYSLWVSDLENDSLFITFVDTAYEVTSCECYFPIRINAGKSPTKAFKLNYNGKFYNIKTSTNIEKEELLNLTILPNPSNGRFKIQGLENSGTIVYEINNLIGQTILRGNSTTNIDLTSKQNGIYILKVIQNNKLIALEKIIKK